MLQHLLPCSTRPCSAHAASQPCSPDKHTTLHHLHQHFHSSSFSSIKLPWLVHPAGDTYLRILQAAKAGAPDIHVHAFSPLEVHQGATSLGLPYASYLAMLKQAGLGSLPGTAAEVLHDDVRQQLCPDKINTQQWLEVGGATALVCPGLPWCGVGLGCHPTSICHCSHSVPPPHPTL